MTTRTFIQQGRGYGPDAVSIVVKLDNVIVYQGTVNTLDETPPEFFDPESGIEVDLFTWTQDINYSGTRALEITVIDGSLLVADTVANYTPIPSTETPLTATSSGPDGFVPFYNKDYDGYIVSEPFANPKIDGVAVERNRGLDETNPLLGQWTYLLEAGSVFTADIKIDQGLDVTP